MTRLMTLIGIGITIAGPAFAMDAASSFAVQCKGCHAINGKSTVAGPSLAGVSGRKIAALSDYSYSAALKAKVGVWSDAALEAYLAAPATFAPGTKMVVRVAQPEQRAALIGYLKSLK